MKFSFSVLMSVYAKDRPAWVRQALDSVLANTVLSTRMYGPYQMLNFTEGIPSILPL